MTAPPASGQAERFEVRVTANDHFAWLRTRLAVERTMMAYMRTSVSLIGFGFAIFQFVDSLQNESGVAERALPLRGVVPRAGADPLRRAGRGVLGDGIPAPAPLPVERQLTPRSPA